MSRDPLDDFYGVHVSDRDPWDVEPPEDEEERPSQADFYTDKEEADLMRRLKQRQRHGDAS